MDRKCSCGVRGFLKLLAFIIICQLAGIIGGLATTTSVNTWYQQINKPSFTPPDWIFGPVWITLYALMGIAVYLVWRQRVSNPKAKTAIVLFFSQLALNALWSILFFGFRSPGLAFIEILALWAFVLFTTIYFFRISLAASGLMLPYILWSSFAVALNFEIWRLN